MSGRPEHESKDSERDDVFAGDPAPPVPMRRTSLTAIPTTPAAPAAAVAVMPTTSETTPPPAAPGTPPPPPPLPLRFALTGLMSPIISDVVPKGMVKLRTVKPGTKLRSLHWTRVPNLMLSHSVWRDADDLIMVINSQRLKQLCGVAKNVTRSSSGKGGSNRGDLIMDGDKARIVGIFLSSGRVDVKDLPSRLCSVDRSTRLSQEDIAALQRVQPTEEDRKKYKGYKGSVNDMQDVDIFMMELCKIEHLGRYLDVQQLLQEFPQQYENLPPLVESLGCAARQVYQPAFKRLLEYMRAIGNYLNAGTARGNCYGFKMSSLLQTTAIKTSEDNYNLLNFIVDTVIPSEKEIEHLPKKMHGVREAAGLSMAQVVAEVEKLERIVEKIISCVKAIVVNKPTVNQQTFYARVLQLVQNYKVDLAGLKKSKDVMVAQLKKMAIYLGEDPKDDPSEVFNPISQFLADFEQAIEKEKARAAKARKASASSISITSSVGEIRGAHTLKKGMSVDSTTRSMPSAKSAPLVNMKPTREGWLDKFGGGTIMKFDKRWFELDTSGSMYFYKKEGGKALGSIYLRGVQATLGESHPGMIIFTFEGRKWQLLAKSRDEALLWLEDMSRYA